MGEVIQERISSTVDVGINPGINARAGESGRDAASASRDRAVSVGVKSRLIGPVVAALLLVTGCGGEGGARAESPTQAAETSTTVDADAYARDMLQSLDETEQQIDATPESASNDYGWGPIAISYEALADHWETLTPPEDLELRHRQLISQARAVGE